MSVSSPETEIVTTDSDNLAAIASGISVFLEVGAQDVVPLPPSDLIPNETVAAQVAEMSNTTLEVSTYQPAADAPQEPLFIFKPK